MLTSARLGVANNNTEEILPVSLHGFMPFTGMTSRFALGALRVAMLSITMLAASCGSSSSESQGSESQSSAEETTSSSSALLEQAHALVRYGEPVTEFADFPDADLLAFRECVIEAVGGELMPIDPDEEVTDPVEAEAVYRQELASSDCAFAHGLDEYAAIWAPPSQSDFEDITERWTVAVDLCFSEVGFDETPTVELTPGFSEPDFVGAIAQDPSIEEPLRACMRREGEEFPGDETPLG